jgi:hypothetical protein
VIRSGLFASTITNPFAENVFGLHSSPTIVTRKFQ